MKNKLITLVLCALLMACASSESTKASFKVWGNCDMCKETIEGALKVVGLRSASWNTESKIIGLEYDSTKISLDEIQKLIAAAGYDNDKYKGDDKAYMDLPECCQYERKK
ncbi:MAG: heavy-metal-associated domain-containing protein [Bacteroidia bacterium]